MWVNLGVKSFVHIIVYDFDSKNDGHRIYVRVCLVLFSSARNSALLWWTLDHRLVILSSVCTHLMASLILDKQ